MKRVKPKTTELWRDSNGFLKLNFVENEYQIEGTCNLYLVIGGKGQLINQEVLANDLIYLLNDWADMKQHIFKIAKKD